ncbi:MAG: prepilin peptidase [Acidimicrobiales bacterium]
MSTVAALGVLGLFGLVIGSFLNVVIVRVPAHESVLRPGSRCPLCEAPIQPRDNIPVLSWLLLRGRCRSCREPIPAGYPLVEVGSAALWVLAGARFGPGATAVAFGVFFSVLLALSVIDLELSILPDRITLPSMLVSLAVLPLLAMTLDNPRRAIIGAVVGGVAYAGGLLLTLLGFELIAKKEGMGFGDVKLAVVLGLWLGWLDPLLILFALIAASVLGLGVGIGYFVVRRKSMPFPFGPWLALGAIVVICSSQVLLDSYGR